MHFQLAWRNIWRNPRRTAVILIAVVIGVWSMVFLGALMVGVSDQMVRNSIATLTGSLQIHSRGYRADPVIDHSMEHPEEVVSVLKKNLPARSCVGFPGAGVCGGEQCPTLFRGHPGGDRSGPGGGGLFHRRGGG